MAETLQLKLEVWDPPDDWLTIWAQLEPWLTTAGEGAHWRLILAFDEYETLHRYLAQDPDQGQRLLGAIRSFSQHQTQVCLLFTGATPFSELRQPDWSEFFVQALRLRLDYLGAGGFAIVVRPLSRRVMPMLRTSRCLFLASWRLAVSKCRI